MSYVNRSLLSEIDIPERGILSRTILNNDCLKIVLFGFSAGHELSAHTAPMAATIQILSGRAKVLAGTETYDLEGGALVWLEPGEEHAISATTSMSMMLTLWKGRG